MIEHPILLDIPERFETNRLLNRAPQVGEGATIHPAIIESIDNLRPWLNWAQHTPTLTDSEIRVRRERAEFLARKYLHFYLWRKADAQFVGGLFIKPDWSIPAFEIGYWQRTSMQGHGYMAEALTGLAEFAFQHLRAQRLEVFCDTRNTRSAAVAERAGFRLEAQLTKSWRNGQGELTDSLLYVRIAPDDDPTGQQP
jgi:RimJ/RimL family protein N-acetyltransferase